MDLGLSYARTGNDHCLPDIPSVVGQVMFPCVICHEYVNLLTHVYMCEACQVKFPSTKESSMSMALNDAFAKVMSGFKEFPDSYREFEYHIKSLGLDDDNDA